VHAVIALELGVVRQPRRGGSSAVLDVVVQIEIVRLVIQREKEEISGCACIPSLPWAVHIGNPIGPEALRPIVPTAGLGGVNQVEGLRNPIRRCFLLVQINGYTRHVRRPTRVD